MRSASTPAPAPRSCMRTSASGARSAPSPVRSAQSITSPTPAKCRNATSAAATPPAPAPARPAPSPTSTPTGPGSTRCASGPARPTPNRAPPPKETTMAWTRKFLRVDLTNGTCKAEPLNMQWAQEYLGQRGLATKYFVEEVDPKVDPLAPENKLIMTTGPLTGTPVSTGGRHRLLELGRLLRRRTQVRRLGHDHLRRQEPETGLPFDRRRQSRTPRRLPPLGQDRVPDRGNHQEDPSGPANPRLQHRPLRRKRRHVRLHR